MRQLTMIALAGLLTGCSIAHTPKELMDVGTQTAHTLTKSPTDAAYCMARNIENFRPSAMGATLHPEVRPLAPGMEVIVRAATLELTTIAVAQLTPAGTGSEARVWMTPRPIVHGREATLKALIEGC